MKQHKQSIDMQHTIKRDLDDYKNFSFDYGLRTHLTCAKIKHLVLECE